MKKRTSLPRRVAGALFVLAAVAVPLYAFDLFPFKMVRHIDRTMPTVLLTAAGAQCTTTTIRGELVYHPLKRTKRLYGTFLIDGLDFPAHDGDYNLLLTLSPSDFCGKGLYGGQLSYHSLTPSDWQQLGALFTDSAMDEFFLLPHDAPGVYVAPAECAEEAMALLSAYEFPMERLQEPPRDYRNEALPTA